MPPGLRLSQGRGVAVATTLACLILGIDALVSEDAAYHPTGVKLLVIVGVAVIGSWRSRGEARSMLRWLSLLAILQAAFWVSIYLAPTGAPRVASTVLGLPLAGWLLAVARVASEMAAARRGDEQTPPG
jgi:hypothetical protein